MERLTVFWTVFTDARTSDAAQRVGERALAALGLVDSHLAIEAYPKTGGHRITFEAEMESATWPEAIVRVLEQAQRVGRGWILHGSILRELDLLSNSASLSGVTMLLCQVARPATDV